MVFFLSAAFAAAAMVTTSKGDVTLDGERAPSAPYVLEEGKALKLEAGATVVVLYSGAATQVTGPTTLRVDDLSSATVSDGDDAFAVLGDLMERTSSTGSVGATRFVGELTLDRPLQGGVVLQPSVIDWSCDSCGQQKVEIIRLLDDESVWTATGTDAVVYDGPKLDPGPYVLEIGGYEFSFKVAKEAEAMAVQSAIGAAKGAVEELEVAAATSVLTTVYLQANMPAEALRTLDEAVAANPDDEDLKAQKVALEKRLGLVE